MKKLKMAVVGAGFWGRNHIRVLSELPEVEMATVCDVDKERAETIAQKYGLRTYTDARNMYRKEELDAVTLCVWSTKLAQEALKALNAGKHVLVEKPMASSTGEAKKILDLSKAKNLHLTVGFIERFNPAVRRLKEAIAEGKIGSPVSATIKRVSKWPQRIGDIGVVKDTAIHDIDITRFIFNEDPSAVYAKAGNLRHKRFEDYTQIMLTFSGGKSAFLEANWLTPNKTRKLTVTGSEAIISLDYITQEMTIETSGQTLTPRYDWEEPLKLELKHFVDCILGNKKPLVTGSDGLKALHIAEAVLSSAEKGCLVNLSF
ncbi:MAG: Gfo/Idh/MocA family oxidoreductase [Candidatus Bathyarchaeota archaeon]|nr:Gfo/Idh/MocA family oxidoreductase [Candidatus Bathyarchaeota archaeon]